MRGNKRLQEITLNLLEQELEREGKLVSFEGKIGGMNMSRFDKVDQLLQQFIVNGLGRLRLCHCPEW